MAGPWEKYQKPQQAEGPWSKFSQQTEAEKPAVNPAQPQTFGHAAAEFGSQVNPIPMITGAWNAIRHPLDTGRALLKAQGDQLSQVPQLVRQGRYSEAFGHGLAGVTPLVGPAAAAIGDKMGGTEPEFDKYGNVVKSGEAPDIAGGIGAGTGLVTSIAAAPALSRAAGRAAKGIAQPLVKNALGLPGKAEAYGAKPALAVLEDTSGVRPSTIARTGQARLTELGKDLDTAAANSTNKASLTPARNVLSRESSSAAGANSEQTPREIARMSKQLTDVRPGFSGDTAYPAGANTPISFQPTNTGLVGPNGQPIAGPPRLVRGAAPTPVVAAEQPARQFLGMKRQFDQDFIHNWNPEASTKHGLGVARQTYNAMADELNRAVPGAEPINNRIQSLIPAVNRAEATSRNAGALQRSLDRIARPTGALVPALIGRQIGGIPGLLAGLGLPEMISVPAAKMTAARTLFGAGRGLGSRIGQRTVQAMPLLRQNQ